MITEDEGTMLYEHELYGTAYSKLPQGYEGPCAVLVEGRTSRTVVFPTVAEAEAAAGFAVGDLGGYSRATITAAVPGQDVTHACWSDWAFEV